MLQEDLSQKKHEPDNIDRCVRAALRVEKRFKRRVTYGEYMALYHTEKSTGRKKAKK